MHVHISPMYNYRLHHNLTVTVYFYAHPSREVKEMDVATYTNLLTWRTNSVLVTIYTVVYSCINYHT